jgi:hypothetical protein
MLATHKPAEKTPVTFEEAAGALSAGLASAIGATPAIEVLALALAKTTLESGREGDRYWVSARHWNIGNIKAGASYSGMFTTYPCNEVLTENGVKRTVWFSPHGRLTGRGGVVDREPYSDPPGHPQTRFRAYANAFDGAYQYVDFVASGRYRDAWAELLEGDAVGYVNALHAKGYFTADPAVYGRGVYSLHKEFIAKLSGRPSPNLAIPSVDVVRSVLAPQDWNEREIMALATHAATEAHFDSLDALRSDALRQMRGADDDEEPTKPDLPGNIS